MLFVFSVKTVALHHFVMENNQGCTKLCWVELCRTLTDVHRANKHKDFFMFIVATPRNKNLKKITIGSTITAPWSTHCAWKSISTGSWLLMTLSVKSSLSWTLKEALRWDIRVMGCDAERKKTPFLVDWNITGKLEDVAVDAERQWKSFTVKFQSLRISSLWAICNNDT